MKTKILLLALLLLPSIAMAQETRSQAAQSLTQLGMSPELSEKVAGLSTGLGVVPNNTYIKARNAANSANINLVGTNASNQVNVAPDSTLILNANSGSTYFNGNLIGDGNNVISLDTADASDNKTLSLTAASAVGTARGASVVLSGNEEGGNPGTAIITGGVASGAGVIINSSASNGTIDLQNNGSSRWRVEADGDLTSQATNGGDLNISSTGKTLALQEATGASACMGEFTAAGTTPVTVTTSCAVTNSRVFFTKKATSAVNGSCYVSGAPDNTNFDITCLATDTGLYNWFIIKEAP